jgi:hypothetical protein
MLDESSKFQVPESLMARLIGRMRFRKLTGSRAKRRRHVAQPPRPGATIKSTKHNAKRVDLPAPPAQDARRGPRMTGSGMTLERVVEKARALDDEVRKEELRVGDRLLVTTVNSRYTIWVLGDGHYWIWGGWFDRQKISPQRVSINGCTWGGSAIKRDIVAAPGLRMEFGNSVLTTRIQAVQVIRARARARAEFN